VLPPGHRVRILGGQIVDLEVQPLGIRRSRHITTFALIYSFRALVLSPLA